MDDRRILAEMERRLSQDDPELVGLMDALNHQFPDAQTPRDALEDADAHDEADAHEVDDLRLDWRWKAIVVFAVVLVAGLILTAVFNRSVSTDDDQGPLNSRASAVAVHTHGRGLRGRSRTPPQRKRSAHDQESDSHRHPPPRMTPAADGNRAGADPWTPRRIGSGVGPPAPVRRRRS
ncbi:hypothetical protein ACFY9S_10875 [Streptomyces sp. NPDC012474]|uniref:hypothetical protein n=1 Tax=Streptomyces sp. NPDC012474 TaxID=3364836 RepID=UPI0036E40C5D